MLLAVFPPIYSALNDQWESLMWEFRWSCPRFPGFISNAHLRGTCVYWTFHVYTPYFASSKVWSLCFQHNQRALSYWGSTLKGKCHHFFTRFQAPNTTEPVNTYQMLAHRHQQQGSRNERCLQRHILNATNLNLLTPAQRKVTDSKRVQC